MDNHGCVGLASELLAASRTRVHPWQPTVLKFLGSLYPERYESMLMSYTDG